MSRSSGSPSGRAFTLAESAVATVVVGVMLGAAIHTVGASRTGQLWNSEKLRALALASALMSEVTDSYYKDPAAAVALFGPETGEMHTARTGLNDVDDYNALNDAPPKARDGTALPNLSAWRRTVTVSWVSPASPGTTSLSETGVKRIAVTVYRGSAKLAELVAYRAAARPR
jgi:type II secretory pathway pseudopilin PulG